MQYTTLFNRLWDEYVTTNPTAAKIYNLFNTQGEKIENDHVAFRTFNNPLVSINVIAKPFLKAGYVPMDTYTFTDKMLEAIHLEIPDNPAAPKVFISQLLVQKFSDNFQRIINQLITSVSPDIYNHPELVLKGNIWGIPDFENYEILRAESEYAAWLYVYGFRVNHFTVSVNSLKIYNTLEKVNQFLTQNGYRLNSAGGEIKGTPEMLLQQSSTLADISEVNFLDGFHKIPSSYYEFALRYPDNNGVLYNGFIAKSADKIFESTNYYQK